MQFTVNHVSLEGLNIPKSDDVIKIGMSKPEYMADDKAIKEAETELGFKLGSQTKEFFKKWAGLYFSGGTEYVSDIKLAVGQTGMIFEEDDRLKNKKIDRIVVGADGFGNHLCADTNDKLSWYYHDSNPVFDTSETKSMKLFAYIEKQFAESKERKSKKAAKESLEAGLEELNTSNKPKSVNINPGKEACGIKFGTKRDQLRSKMGEGSFKEFKKTKTKKYPVDDFGYMHVYYNADAQVEGVEIFDDVDVMCNSITLIPNTFDKVVKSLKKIDENVKVNKSSIVSRKLNIGLSIRDDKVTSVFAGVEGYYGSDASVESFMYENMKAYTACEPSLEYRIDPSSMKGDLESGAMARIRFTVFGKQVACSIFVGCGVDKTVPGQMSKLSQFNVDTGIIEQLNIVIPKIDKIIEGATDKILSQCQKFHDSVTETSKRKKLNSADLKQHFVSAGIVPTYVKQGGSWKPAIGISLDGKYSTPDVWDEEHGVGLVVVDGKVIECGASDIIY
jgi:hypothetical protein